MKTKKDHDFTYFNEEWNETDYNDSWTDHNPSKKESGLTVED